MGMQVRKGFEFNQKGNYKYNVGGCWPTCTQAVYKVHRGIRILINLFLLPGVYSNALDVVMEDIWR